MRNCVIKKWNGTSQDTMPWVVQSERAQNKQDTWLTQTKWSSFQMHGRSFNSAKSTSQNKHTTINNVYIQSFTIIWTSFLNIYNVRLENSHCSDYKQCCLLGCDSLLLVEMHHHFGAACCLQFQESSKWQRQHIPLQYWHISTRLQCHNLQDSVLNLRW